MAYPVLHLVWTHLPPRSLAPAGQDFLRQVFPLRMEPALQVIFLHLPLTSLEPVLHLRVTHLLILESYLVKAGHEMLAELATTLLAWTLMGLLVASLTQTPLTRVLKGGQVMRATFLGAALLTHLVPILLVLAGQLVAHLMFPTL